jgi:hypothetical protein
MNGLKIIIRNMELLVIDEVSICCARFAGRYGLYDAVRKKRLVWCCMVIYCNYRP